jgi:oligopeptide transport system substrate-binding protein
MLDMVVNAIEIREEEEGYTPDDLGIKALDNRTVAVTLTYDCPYFFEIAAFNSSYPLRKDIIEQAGEQWTFDPATYISNGHYRMKEWVHNSHILIEKNPHYYETVSGPDRIRFSMMSDTNAELVGFRNGGLDFIIGMPPDEIPGLIKKGEIHVFDTRGTFYIMFNNAVAPFNDPRVRKALSLVIDRNYLVNQITQTGEKPANGFVPNGIPDAAPGSDFRDTGGGYFSVAEADYRANVTEARRLLAEAGFPDGKGFPVFEFSHIAAADEDAIAEAYQNMWQTELGITVTLGSQEWGVYLDSLYGGDYTVATYSWIADYGDPSSFLEMLITGNSNNISNYSDSAYDALRVKVRTAAPAERMALMHEAEDIIIGRDLVIAPIFSYTAPYMISPRLSGFYHSAIGMFFKNVKVTR